MKNYNQVCSRCLLPDTYPNISFDNKGVCSVCKQYDERWSDWEGSISKRKENLYQLSSDAQRKKREFDVLIPLSGGKDSMYVLWYAVKKLGLKVLAFTMNNGYLTQHAKNNIDEACERLEVEHINYNMDKKIMNQLFSLFMRKTGYFCSACMRCIGMTTELIADLYKVPLVFGGSCKRTELPLVREMFQPGNVEYVRKIIADEELEYEARRILYEGSLSRKIGYRIFWWGTQKRLLKYAWINLPDYIEWNYEKIYDTIKNELNWFVPARAEEHSDCGLHETSKYIHNRRFPGLEVEILTLSRLIQSGQITRKNALAKIKEKDFSYNSISVDPTFLQNINMSKKEFDMYIDMGPRFLNYQTSPSKSWKILRNLKRTTFSIIGLGAPLKTIKK